MNLAQYLLIHLKIIFLDTLTNDSSINIEQIHTLIFLFKQYTENKVNMIAIKNQTTRTHCTVTINRCHLACHQSPYRTTIRPPIRSPVNIKCRISTSKRKWTCSEVRQLRVSWAQHQVAHIRHIRVHRPHSTRNIAKAMRFWAQIKSSERNYCFPSHTCAYHSESIVLCK